MSKGLKITKKWKNQYEPKSSIKWKCYLNQLTADQRRHKGMDIPVKLTNKNFAVSSFHSVFTKRAMDNYLTNYVLQKLLINILRHRLAGTHLKAPIQSWWQVLYFLQVLRDIITHLLSKNISNYIFRFLFIMPWMEGYKSKLLW
jgi:Holliday junction resolvase RusA-like endonuclease